MGDFVLAIPSYHRAGKQGTLEYLSGMGIPKEQIYIFVQTGEDAEEYGQYSDRCNIIYESANGVAKARNNILQYFNGSRDIFMLDDDISCIGRLRGKDVEPITDAAQFTEAIGNCFSQARRAGAPIWGVYPVDNAYFMERSISTKTTVNTAVGFTRGRVLKFDESFDAKEDIELCARVLHRGGTILRYNYLCVSAKHRTNPGGCYEAWHSPAHREVVGRLCRMYPDVLAPHARKPDEVRVILKGKIGIGGKQ